MFKKIVSIAIAAMMLGSTAAIAATAAEDGSAVAAADDSSAVAAADDSAVGADDGSESTSAGSKIYFDAASSGWKTYKKIYLYLYDHNNGEMITWGSKKGMMTDEGNNTWSYDLADKGFNLDSSNSYGCIFTADWGMQTCDLILGSACIGDTAYCTGTTVENNVDSNKSSFVVKWKNADQSKYSNPVQITSTGKVIGEAYWPGETAESVFTKFLTSDNAKENLSNDIKYNGKTVQQTVDDSAAALGLSLDTVTKIVNDNMDKAKSVGVDLTKWDASKSTLSGGSSGGGTTGGGTTGGGSTGGGSTGGGSTGGGTTGGASTGGSGSVTSGEDTTIYFIIGGVMLAAIGVFFRARKRREY